MATATAIRNLIPLFIGLALIALAVGSQGSLLGVRSTIEGFGDVVTGGLMSAYFVGFLLGARYSPRIIKRVGLVRSFGALSALASVTILIHSVIIDPTVWMFMRLLTGFAFSSIYVVSESWLNNSASNQNRGQILSIYMVIMLAGICLGQLFLKMGDPASFELFTFISVLVSVAAIPILVTASEVPAIELSTKNISIKEFYQISPMGFFGVVLVQACYAVVLGMAVVYGLHQGRSVDEVAVFMAVMLAGGIVSQWPLGKLSDSIDRRWVLGFTMLCSAVAALMIVYSSANLGQWYLWAAVFGACCFPNYSIVIAIVNDFLEPQQIMPATATIAMISGLSASVAPLAVAMLMESLGSNYLFISLAMMCGLLAVIALYRAMFIPWSSDVDRYPTFVQVPSPIGTVLHADVEAVVGEEHAKAEGDN
ncbi:MFS transporter [Dasania sp. GY-MA-18]|uniref:MFS transporter n=1 Tax=Dasania phycosphaerae TaxID=2950436 RepID=A0A9J6RN14_9GAMM|nr:MULTISPECIES: MFS transporter [Dasania]MCR8922958.1 MFS transporter [Dasania sp. GY-MA-18]MCZ0865389.1 MFS transporter [Dasania phycosphaerae]MCZ0869114.1 MFS transporter [Dasania phycosphaerae]